MIIHVSERGRRQSCTACSSPQMFQSYSTQSALPQPSTLLSQQVCFLCSFSDLGLAKNIQTKANDGTLSGGLRDCASNHNYGYEHRVARRSVLPSPLSCRISSPTVKPIGSRVVLDGIMIASDLLWHLRVAAQNLTAFGTSVPTSRQLLHRSVN